MRFFKRRSSDPNPQLVNLSVLSDPEFCSPTSNKVNKDSVFQNFENLAITNNRTQNDDQNDLENSNRSETMEISDSQFKLIYDKYKDLSAENKKSKSPRSQISIDLSEQQLLDYLKIIQPNMAHDKFLDSLFTNSSEENLAKKSKISRFKSFKNLFSRSCKSDDEDDFKFKKTSSTGSLTSLTNFILNKRDKSSSTKIKPADSGYGSDSPKGSIKSHQTDNTDAYYNGDTDTADEDDDGISKPNVLKRPRVKNDYYETSSTISRISQNLRRKTSNINKDFNLKYITLKLDINRKSGLRITPSVVFASGATGAYFITEITPGSSADRQGYLRVGDEIVEINGHKLKGVSLATVNSFLQPANGILKILSRRIDTIKFTPFNPKLKAKRSIRQSNSNNINTNQKKPDKYCTTDPIVHKSSISILPPKRKPSGYSSSTCSSINRSEKEHLKVLFKKGVGCKSLGFSVVGGRDSPKGMMGIYVKRIFQGGQAEESILQEGDQIISVNQLPLQGLTHIEAVSLFKSIKTGEVIIDVLRKKKPVKFRSQK